MYFGYVIVVQFSVTDEKLNTQINGGVAQLGEHLPCKQGVMGSIPIISTSDGSHEARGDEATKLTTMAHSSGG